MTVDLCKLGKARLVLAVSMQNSVLESDNLSPEEVGDGKELFRIVFWHVDEGQQPSNVKDSSMTLLTDAKFLFAEVRKIDQIDKINGVPGVSSVVSTTGVFKRTLLWVETGGTEIPLGPDYDRD